MKKCAIMMGMLITASWASAGLLVGITDAHSATNAPGGVSFVSGLDVSFGGNIKLHGSDCGSTTGTYGALGSGASTAAEKVFSITSNNQTDPANDYTLEITFANNTGDDIELDALGFDYLRPFNHPPELYVTYLSGDLSISDGADLFNFTSTKSGDNTYYGTYNGTNSVLTGETLANGGSFTIKFDAYSSTADKGGELALDNIGLFGTAAIPEPATLSLIGVAGLGALFIRRRRLK